MIDTVPIIYTGGGFGTFVHWSVYYFSNRINYLPFNTNGNSHNFEGIQIRDIPAWEEFCANGAPNKVVRMHPKFESSSSIASTVALILRHTNKAIFLDSKKYPLMTINNKYSKILEKGVADQISKYVDYSRWDHHSYDDMARWERRELLSMFTMQQHIAETDDRGIDQFSDKLCMLDIGLLFTDYETSIRSLMNFIELPIERTNFDEIYEHWRPLQVHYGKDKLIDQIISATVDGKFMAWDGLSLFDEAIIQMQLRDLHKLDMLCYNINVFPTNTTDLRNILING